MPPYFSVEIVFPYKSFNTNFVRETYSTLFRKFPYLSGYWNSEDNSLTEIIDWNQRLLSNKFILGYEEHVSNNYKQILMHDKRYSEIRSFWIYDNEEIRLSVIIPEDDMLLDEDVLKFKKDQFRLIKELCLMIWANSQVTHIQSCLELDYGPTRTKELQNGVLPSLRPISIVNNHIYGYLKEKLKETIEVVEIQNNGVLILDQNLF